MTRADVITVILCVGVFTSVVNIVMLIPVLDDIASDFNVSAAAIGQLATVHAVVATIVALLAAPLLDRFARSRVLRIECAVLIVGTVISATAQTYWWLAAGRVVAGMGAAIIIATCLAIMTDLYPDETIRNRRFGLLGSSAALGTVVGLPVLTQIAAHSSWHWAVAAVAIPAMIVGLGSWLLPAETACSAAHEPLRQEYVRRYRMVLGSSRTTWLLAVQLVISAVINGLWLYFGAWVKLDFGITAASLSVLFILSGLCELATSNLTPRLLERFGPLRVFIAEAVVLSACLLTAGLVFNQAWALYPFVVLVSLTGIGLLFVNVVLLIDAQPDAAGAVMSVQAAVGEFGAAVGAAVGGIALSLFGSYTAVYRGLGLILILAIVFLLIRARSLTVEQGRAIEQPAV